MSKSPKSSKIMASASPFVFGRIPMESHLNMDLSIYTPTWHRVLLSGKNSNPTGSHPLLLYVICSQVYDGDGNIR